MPGGQGGPPGGGVTACPTSAVFPAVTAPPTTQSTRQGHVCSRLRPTGLRKIPEPPGTLLYTVKRPQREKPPDRTASGSTTTLSGRRPPRDELVSGLAVPGCTGAEGTRGNVDLGHRPDAQTPTAPLPSALQPGWPKAQGLSTLAARQAPIQRLVSQAALRERVWKVGSGAWPTT